MTVNSTAATIGSVFCGISALEHVYIFLIETFLWYGRGTRVFALKDPLQAKMIAPVIAQVGIYNMMIALGLVWGLLWNQANEKILFLTLVLIAASFGATSFKGTILLTQGSPALLGLLFVIFGEKQTHTYSNPDNGVYWLLGTLAAGGLSALMGWLWYKQDQRSGK